MASKQGMAQAVNISFPPGLKEKVQDLAKRKNFKTMSGYLQHLVNREVRKEEFRTEFEQYLKAGLDSGPSLQTPEDFIAKGKQRLLEKSS